LTPQDFIGTANISADRLEHSRTYDTPIDCVWTIRAEKDFKIYLQFPEYHLIQPNDCHLNYIQAQSTFCRSYVYTSYCDDCNVLEFFANYRQKGPVILKSNILIIFSSAHIAVFLHFFQKLGLVNHSCHCFVQKYLKNSNIGPRCLTARLTTST
jgi:hypothetical protein